MSTPAGDAGIKEEHRLFARKRAALRVRSMKEVRRKVNKSHNLATWAQVEAQLYFSFIEGMKRMAVLADPGEGY